MPILKRTLTYLALALSLAACGGGDSQSNNSASAPLNVELNARFGALFVQQITNNSPQTKVQTQDSAAYSQLDAFAQTRSINIDKDTYFDGLLEITSMTSGSVQTFDWPLTLTTDGQVISHRSLSLKPDTYQFKALFTHGARQYVAIANNQAITADSQPSIDLVLQPHLGDTTINLEDIDALANIDIRFNADDLSKLSQPKLGVRIDNGDETVYTLDKTSGITGFSVPVGDGQYDLVLRLYDDNQLVGIMKNNVGTVAVEEGSEAKVEIIPLSADVNFHFDTSDETSNYNIRIPQTLVDRVGNIDKLTMVMRLSAGDRNQETEHSFHSINGHYELSDDVPPTFNPSGKELKAHLTFYEKKVPQQYNKALATCSFTVNAGAEQTKTCKLSIDVSHQISGSILSTLVLSVAHRNNPTLAKGASIYMDDTLVGITGSQFNAASLKTHLPPGEHTIRAEKDGLEASFTHTFHALEVVDQLLFLDVVKPDNFKLTQINSVADQPKTFKLTWQDNSNWATSYQVCTYDATRVDNYFCNPLGEEIISSTTETSKEVYLDSALLSDDIQFMVLAKHNDEVVATNSLTPTIAQRNSAIGYFEVPDPYYFGGYGGDAIALSADGNTLVIGKSYDSSDATGVNGDPNNSDASDSGSVYILTRTATGWQQQAYIKASNTDSSDYFGESVSLSADGSTLAVSARREDSNATGVNGDQDDNSAENSGAVYIFTRTGTDWQQQAYIKASNTDSKDYFGAALSLSDNGNTLAISTNSEDSEATGINGDQNDNSATGSGAVYIYTRTGTDWQQMAYVKASNTDSSDLFGKSVSLSGNGRTLAVGAMYESSNTIGINGEQHNNNAKKAGAVYVFSLSGLNWQQQAYIKASNTDAGDNFGISLSLNANGNTLAIGADKEASDAIGVDGDQANNKADNSGAVYVFSRIGTNWDQQAYIKASNTDVNSRFGDNFGNSVSLSDDGKTLAVGAQSEESDTTGVNGDQTNNNANGSGAVYIFSRTNADWQQKGYIKASNTGKESVMFGYKVSISGDGRTLAVGGRNQNNTPDGKYTAYLY
ncbi:FG-GAP repeat protein [Photobacterium chitinilyticum]|uniref:hypothetical protein n=1 Tax=Photobacterium chitinilyticum TaxID=2485123 RepID=UPI003D111B73